MMDAQLRALVHRRAEGRREYCKLSQEHQLFHRFHVKHIVPRKHGGATEANNLALACRNCNLHKGPNLTGIDPETGTVVPLFNPRGDTWQRHFRYEGASIIGITPMARATVRVLAMNDPDQVELRTVAGF